MIRKFEEAKDLYLVAAALIATVTFAAMLTLPGDNNRFFELADSDIACMNQSHREAINGENPGPTPFDVEKEAWQTLSIGRQLGLVFSQPDGIVVNFLVEQINSDMLAFKASRS
ncbi:hypothetical protein GH714_033320 [Hevea brasiliensis]|uniref:PGG domain-containing protein n=1 Tax=Hevea brasiliensis TaxID=3981 RepID=A0A6A6NKE7_HEVBR|nr:hypothetical protein GH714_033320 [Hevea brasiliensis]